MCVGWGFSLFLISFKSSHFSLFLLVPASPSSAGCCRGHSGPVAVGPVGAPRCRGPLGSPGARAESNSVSASEPSQPPTGGRGSAPRPPCCQPRAGRGRGGAHDRPAPTRHPPSGAPGGPSRGAGVPVTTVRGQQAHRFPLPTPH